MEKIPFKHIQLRLDNTGDLEGRAAEKQNSKGCFPGVLNTVVFWAKKQVSWDTNKWSCE